VLLLAVLDSLPIYFMSSFLIPIFIIKAINARRRDFFWATEETCTGAKCLVAWDKLCIPTNRGGLGAKNSNAQNICILLKFCFKFLHAENLPWKQWILSQSPNPFTASTHSYLSRLITKHLHMLVQITTCTIHNGKSVFFWHDTWLLPEPLATAFPALYSHHTQTHALVCDIMQLGISNGLRCRLTNAASEQLVSLSNLLQDVTLSEAQDTRSLLDGSPFSTKGAYLHLQSQLEDPDVSPIWKSRVPRKVKVFGWLLHLNRLNTRANLLHKHIIDSAACPRCQAQVEDRAHLFFHCPSSAAIWRQLKIIPTTAEFTDIWDTTLPNNLPRSVWSSVALTILWKIWDTRNAKVFRDIDHSPLSTVRNIISDFTLWSHRFKQAGNRVDADLWRAHLSTCNL
jgi:hypothetical protein